jgi:HSP20 family protein
MKLIPYKNRTTPFSLLDELHEEINRLFHTPFDRTPALLREDFYAPSVDISEDDANIYVDADIPGFDQKNIKVNVKNDMLTISAKRDEKKEEKKKNFHRVERIQGSFYRQILLPSDVNTDKVKASYKNGVLKIVLPKKEESKAKDVDITVG